MSSEGLHVPREKLKPRTLLQHYAITSLVEELEAELGIPIYDSVATVVWKSLRMAGADTRRVCGWGRLFREL